MSSNPYVTKVELGVELDKQNQKIDLKVNNLELGVNGSIDTTTGTVSLPDGVYRAQIPGTYTNAGNIVVKEGYYTLLRKDNGVWKLESEVKIPMQDLTPLNNRITQVENYSNQKVEKKVGSNLFDRGYIILKGMIRSDGSVTTNSIDLYATTGYIKIDSEGLIISPNTLHPNAYNALFDANKNYIAGTATKDAYLPYVEGAVYAMFSISTTTQNVRVNKGQTALPYEPFNPIAGYPSIVPDNSISTSKLVDKSVTVDKLGYDVYHKFTQNKPSNNLFDKEAITPSSSINAYGVLVPNPPYHVTDFIPVVEGETYIKSTTQTSVYFDKNFVKVGTYFQTQQFTVPTGINAKYVRCMLPVLQLDTWQMNLGTELLPYEPYNLLYGYLKDFQPDVNDLDIKIALPNTLPAVVDDNLQIYKSGSFINVNKDNYDYKIVCSEGKNFPNLFEVKPTSADNLSSKCIVKDSDGNVLKTKLFTIAKKAKLTSPTTAKKILCVGASATANGYWVRELKRRLTETSGDGTPMNPTGLGLSNISFTGRKTALGNNLEATGGWSWVDFTTEGRQAYRVQVSNVTNLVLGTIYTQGTLQLELTEINITGSAGNLRFALYGGSGTLTTSGTLTRGGGSGDSTITYTGAELEMFNPFWNNGKLDFVNYANLYCSGDITTLITHLGVNDIFASKTSAQIVAMIKTFANALFTDFPNAKLIVTSLPLPCNLGGMGQSYGASETNDYYTKALQFYDFFNALEELQNETKFVGKVYHSPIIPQFDNENAYPTINTNANNRSSNQVVRGQNGVHPTEDGAKLIADAIYRTLHLSGF